MRQVEKLGGAGLCLLSLLGGQLLVIYLLQAQLTQALFSRPEFLYLQVLPGLVWPLAGAWLFSAWHARRHPGVTALPFGYSLGLAGLLTTSLMVPMYQQAVAKMPPESACSLTWSACVALTLVIGLCQILLAPFAHRLTFSLSLPVCLGLGAAVGVQSIAGLLPWLQQHPLLLVAGLVPLVAYLMVGLPRPFGLSAGWLVLGTGLAGQIFSGTSFEVPDFQSSLLPNWQLGWIEEGLQFLWLRTELLTVALPVLVAVLARDLVLLRETQAYPNAPAARTSLLGLGCLNVLGACLGCGLPLAVLPGYLGYRRWGGGQFYCQAAGLLLVLFSLLGGSASFLPGCLYLRWESFSALCFWARRESLSTRCVSPMECSWRPAGCPFSPAPPMAPHCCWGWFGAVSPPPCRPSAFRKPLWWLWWGAC